MKRGLITGLLILTVCAITVLSLFLPESLVKKQDAALFDTVMADDVSINAYEATKWMDNNTARLLYEYMEGASSTTASYTEVSESSTVPAELDNLSSYFDLYQSIGINSENVRMTHREMTLNGMIHGIEYAETFDITTIGCTDNSANGITIYISKESGKIYRLEFSSQLNRQWTAAITQEIKQKDLSKETDTLLSVNAFKSIYEKYSASDEAMHAMLGDSYAYEMLLEQFGTVGKTELPEIVYWDDDAGGGFQMLANDTNLGIKATLANEKIVLSLYTTN